MFKMEMQWKEFNVSLPSIDAFCKAQSEDYKGNSADSALGLWFENEPSDEIKVAIQAKWDGMSDSSAEVVNYKSRDQIAAEQAAKKASGKAKLLALGLTEDEIAALRL